MKHTLLKILSSRWLVEEELATSFYLQLYNSLATGTSIDVSGLVNSSIVEAKISSIAAASSESTSISSSQEANYIAVVQIKGALMKDDQYCGPQGMNSIAAKINAYKDSEKCIGLILQIDSPGGTVDGTSNLAKTVANFGKPVIAHVDGMAASAAYWIASQADLIYLNDNLDRVGSIGVQLTIADIEKFYEANDLKIYTVKSDGSEEKNNILTLLRKGDEKTVKEDLNYIKNEFFSAIRRNRNPGEAALTGKMFFADKAIELGLIDGIKSFNDCVDEILSIHETNSQNKSQKASAMKKQYARVNSTLNVESLESVEEHVSLNEEQIAALDAALESGAKSAELAEQRSSSIEMLNVQIAERDATIASQRDQINALQNRGPIHAGSAGNTNTESVKETVAAREERLANLANTDFNAYLEELKKDC